jgi:Ca-activated chloride channel family protein
VQTPLTYDRDAVAQALNETVVGLAGRDTAIGDAIGLAVKRLRAQPSSSRVLVLLTDGDNTVGALEPAGPTPDAGPDAVLAAAGRLRAMGHRLSVPALAGSEPFKDLVETGGGILVESRVDDLDTARLIALQVNGRRAASGERIADAGQWRGDGLWLLLLVLPLAAFAFRPGWLGLLPLSLCLLPPAPVQALSWNDFWLRPEQQAWPALERGDAEQAGERFDAPRWRAAASYRAGDYARALAELVGLQDAEAHYNRGNVLVRLRRDAVAVAEYDAALLIDPEHRDARHNRELLQALLPVLLQEQAEPHEADAMHSDEPAEPPNEPPEHGSNDADGDGSSPDSGPDSGASSGPDSAAASGEAGSVGEPAEPAGVPGAIAEPERANVQSDIGVGAPAGNDRATAADSVAARDRGAAAAATETGGQRLATADRQSSPAFADRARQAPRVAADGEPVAAPETAMLALAADGEQGPLDDPAVAASIAYLLRQVPDDPARLLRWC